MFNLEKRFAVVGVMEHFKTSIALMEAMLPRLVGGILIGWFGSVSILGGNLTYLAVSIVGPHLLYLAIVISICSGGSAEQEKQQIQVRKTSGGKSDLY